mgnify:CR=1 FL=1
MRRKYKALSPVIAVLLLVIIAAVAAVMLYVWFSSYFTTQAGKVAGLTGIKINVEKIQFRDYNKTDSYGYKTVMLVVTVTNLADESVTLDLDRSIGNLTVQFNGVDIFMQANQTGRVVQTPDPLTIPPGESRTLIVRLHNETGFKINNEGIKKGQTYDVVVSLKVVGESSGSIYEDVWVGEVSTPPG